MMGRCQLLGKWNKFKCAMFFFRGGVRDVKIWIFFPARKAVDARREVMCSQNTTKIAFQSE